MIITKEKAIDNLIANDIDKMDDNTVADMLREGCKGYENMTDDELAEIYEEQFSYELEACENVVIEEGKK